MDSSAGPGRAAFGRAAIQRLATYIYSSRKYWRPPRVSETFFRLHYFIGLHGSPDTYNPVFGGLSRDESCPVRWVVHFRLSDRSRSRTFVLGNRDHSERERIRGFESAGTGRKQHDY